MTVVADILREIKWYHILGLVLGLAMILVLVLFCPGKENQPRVLPGSDNGDII